jgi:glycolate oxidase FAD binding subunit
MNTTAEPLARQLEAELGAAALSVDPSTLAAHPVDGKTPALICTPATPDQTALAIRICRAAHAAVIPWGGGTAMAIGNPPRRADVILKTHRLDRVVDRDHANLTVTVQSGITLNVVQATIAPQRQCVPFDAPFPGQSTIGGIIAANLNGPRRSSFGSVRDLVIGMKVILGTGEQIKAGGKVVKNVAGYDMCKLFTGSLGTLGIITEVTVRVAPLPQSRATIVVNGTLQQAIELADALADSKLLPSAVFLFNDARGQDWQLTVCFEGFEQCVARQLRDLENLSKAIDMRAESLNADNQLRVWREIQDLPLTPGRLVYRVTVPRRAVAELLIAVQSWRAAAEMPTITADLTMGTVWIVCAANKIATSYFPKLTSLAQRARGHAVMFAAPAELKSGIEVWGPAAPTLALMGEIKRRFDPAAILNPGRFVGGL